jgi:energy-coupling factor transport system ATP-binding protein
MRRLALASVLSARPSVLVLDEPTAGLDSSARAHLLERMLAWKAAGLTLVVISHDVEELAVLADRVAVLEEGRVAAVGELRELVAQGLVPAPLAGRVMPGALTLEEVLAAVQPHPLQ